MIRRTFDVTSKAIGDAAGLTEKQTQFVRIVLVVGVGYCAFRIVNAWLPSR